MENYWRTSSFSFANGNCVEAGYRTSSYSHANGNCAEAASGEGEVLVRDTMDRGGPVLAFSAVAWGTFTAKLKSTR